MDVVAGADDRDQFERGGLGGASTRAMVKVRIGVAVGGRGTLALDRLGPAVDCLEALGFDSIWLPETFLTGSDRPAGRTVVGRRPRVVGSSSART